MSVYKATSWGRTRRPKALSDDHSVSSKETSVEVVAVTTGSALVDALNAVAKPECNGYSTENQRYLHVYVKDASATDSVAIFGYNYAFGKWAPILEHDGDGTRSIMTATCGSSGAAQLYIFDISGVDRVGFVGDIAGDDSTAPDVIFAACTTFQDLDMNIHYRYDARKN